MDLNEFVTQDKAELIEQIARMEKSREDAHHRRKTAERLTAKLQDDLDHAHQQLDELAVLKGLEDVTPPPWLEAPSVNAVNKATPFLVLSDLHLDEKVDLVEMDGQNEYSRQIAEDRFAAVIDGTIELCDRYVDGVEFDGIIAALAGDIITGIIHDELAETNEATIPETIMHWAPILASGISRLADYFGNVFVPCVDGNHDRMYKKMRMKKRSVSSYSWIIYNSIAMLTADDDRIDVHVSRSPEYLFNVYGTRFLLDHGDKFRGGGGIGGIYPSMLKWVGRKRQVPGREFDYAVVGHWHQLIYHSDIIVNGSLKGFDEYARAQGFRFERPQQALFFVTPENGITMRTQVFAN